MITTRELLANVAKRNDIKELSPRDEYFLNRRFIIGDFVTDGNIIGEIIYRGSNYVTVVSEGKEFKLWLESIIEVEGETKRNQIYKESYIFKGYKTKNLTRDISEQFKSIAKETKDTYALLSCLKCCDYIAGISTDYIIENFIEVKVQLERAKRYTDKFSINIDEHIKFVEENCLKYSILENQRFSTTDSMMIARVIASVADVEPDGIDPSGIINKSIIKFKNTQLNSAGWVILGRMLNMATHAGIRWNKSAFGASEQTMMKLI